MHEMSCLFFCFFSIGKQGTKNTHAAQQADTRGEVALRIGLGSKEVVADKVFEGLHIAVARHSREMNMKLKSHKGHIQNGHRQA